MYSAVPASSACYLLVSGEDVDHKGFLSLVDKVDGPSQPANRHDRKQRTKDLFLHDLWPGLHVTQNGRGWKQQQQQQPQQLASELVIQR